jgi:hypothetical protein
VFIVQTYQTSQYVVPRGGNFLGKWRSSFAGNSDGKMNVQSACALNSRDSSAGIITGYWLDGRGSITGMGKRFFLYSTASIPAMGTIKHFTQSVPRLNRPGREANRSPPYSAEIKTGGTITPILIRLRGVVIKYTDNFYLLYCHLIK